MAGPSAGRSPQSPTAVRRDAPAIHPKFNGNRFVANDEPTIPLTHDACPTTGDLWPFDGPDGPMASGQVVEALPQYRFIELGIQAVYPTRKFLLPKVRALVEFLSVRLAGTDWIHI